ncbi:MAG TPA: NAD(P)H-dependent oxidoreductase [Stellaceae bacterium]|nr:NAD(P)H-dependent oxidoreductase [Stellaceae bacterium]
MSTGAPRKMHAHIVLAHPEPKSFNAHLAEVARGALEKDGWSVTASDLYAMGFDPCERAEHFSPRQNPERFDVQAEQRFASDRGALPAPVAAEIAALDLADLVILQYPMWWHLPPAMLKGWLDRVLVYGEVYTSKKRFEHGRWAGKRAMLSLTVGTSPETYAFDGRSGDIDLMLWPVNFSLAYVGFTVLAPFIAYGVESGLRYSSAEVLEARLCRVADDLAARMHRIDATPVIPFNRMADWTETGRIKATAPAYSAFMRHREKLDLA